MFKPLSYLISAFLILASFESLFFGSRCYNIDKNRLYHFMSDIIHLKSHFLSSVLKAVMTVSVKCIWLRIDLILKKQLDCPDAICNGPTNDFLCISSQRNNNSTGKSKISVNFRIYCHHNDANVILWLNQYKFTNSHCFFASILFIFTLQIYQLSKVSLYDTLLRTVKHCVFFHYWINIADEYWSKWFSVLNSCLSCRIRFS